MEKYITVSVSKIIMQIAMKTEIEGYTEGVLEAFLPDSPLTGKEEKDWIKSNNKRMKAICKFLNDNDL